MRSPQKSLTSSPKCRARRHTMPRRIGPMRRHNSYSGQSRNTAPVRTLHHRNLTSTIGLRLRVSFQAGMTRNANTNLIRTRNQPSRKVIGSKEKTKSWSGSSGRRVPSNGVRLLVSLMRTSACPEMESNAGRDGLTS
jgi:hypothetical protein